MAKKKSKKPKEYEIVKIIKWINPHFEEHKASPLSEDELILLQNIKKNKPKEPVKSKNSDSFCCPNCGYSYGIKKCTSNISYCRKCGQIIDWSKINQ